MMGPKKQYVPDDATLEALNRVILALESVGGRNRGYLLSRLHALYGVRGTQAPARPAAGGASTRGARSAWRTEYEATPEYRALKALIDAPARADPQEFAAVQQQAFRVREEIKSRRGTPGQVVQQPASGQGPHPSGAWGQGPPGTESENPLGFPSRDYRILANQDHHQTPRPVTGQGSSGAPENRSGGNSNRTPGGRGRGGVPRGGSFGRGYTPPRNTTPGLVETNEEPRAEPADPSPADTAETDTPKGE